MKQAETIQKRATAGEMAKDPICGTYVEADGNIRVKEGETVHIFCSYECRDKYLKQLEATTNKED